jgi:hypothetical protein
VATNKPQKATIPNIEGTRGESLFYESLGWTVQEDLKLLSGHYKEYERVLIKLGEDRLLVLVGSLSLEDDLDYFLAAYIPHYKYLSENRDFTFSMKIDLGRSLCLIPKHLLDAADLVRYIRNEFAHNLEMTSFSSLKAKTKRKLRTSYKVLYRTDRMNIPYSEKFGLVVGAVMHGFEIYTSHLRNARKFIYSDDFTNELKKRVVSRRR